MNNPDGTLTVHKVDSQTFKTDRDAIAGKVGTESRRQKREGRYYKIDGQEYPSVTTILSIINKPALVPWAAKMEREAVMDVAADMWDELRSKSLTVIQDRTIYRTLLESRVGKQKASAKELQAAGEIGTQAHEMIDWHLRQLMGLKIGPAPKVSDKALWAFMAFEDWAREVQLLPLRTEQVVYSKTHKYAGTLDLLAWLIRDGERRLALVDFKTGKAVYDEAKMQVVTYAEALAEMGLETPDILLILRLPKLETDPEFEVVEVGEFERHFNGFLAAQKLWEWQRANEKERT